MFSEIGSETWDTSEADGPHRQRGGATKVAQAQSENAAPAPDPDVDVDGERPQVACGLIEYSSITHRALITRKQISYAGCGARRCEVPVTYATRSGIRYCHFILPGTVNGSWLLAFIDARR